LSRGKGTTESCPKFHYSCDGDGIVGIMAATLHILEESGADLEIETIDIGRKFISRIHPGSSQRLGFAAADARVF